MGKYVMKRDEIEAFLIGLVISGTGGGGESEWGRVIMENDFNLGRSYEFVDPEDIADDALVCSGGIMGSVKSLEGISYPDITAEWEKDFPLVNAVRMMEKIQGRKVDYMLPFEVGALNTPVIMAACARLGIPMINGDAVGRSAPETQMTSLIGNGVELYPMPIVDRAGNASIVMQSDSPTYADEVGRMIVIKGGNLAANSHYPMSGRQLKDFCIPHTVTGSIALGQAVLAAQMAKGDGVEAVRKVVGGKLAHIGKITEIVGEDKGGFYLTNVAIQGVGEFADRKAQLVIKNETMALFIDGAVKCIFPDIALMLNPATGEGYTSVQLKEGIDLAIVLTPCHERLERCMQDPIGKVALGAARFGHPELPYQPLRELAD